MVKGGGGIAQLYPSKAAQNMVMHIKSQQRVNMCKVKEPCIIACRFLKKHCQGCCCTVARHCQMLNLILLIFLSCSLFLSPSSSLYFCLSYSKCFKISLLFTTTAPCEPISNTARKLICAPPPPFFSWSDFFFIIPLRNNRLSCKYSKHQCGRTGKLHFSNNTWGCREANPRHWSFSANVVVSASCFKIHVFFFLVFVQIEQAAWLSWSSSYFYPLSPDKCEHGARIKLRQMNQWIHTITPQTPMSYDFTPLWFYFHWLNAG